MSDLTNVFDLIILLIAALGPALVYLAWVRKSERYAQEAWGTLLQLFGYGAIFATVIAGILEAIILAVGNAAATQLPGPEFIFLNSSSTPGLFFLVLVVAPFIEEALKASGVYRVRTQIRSFADGPVFGASVGLGFGFFETFLYGLAAFLTGGLVSGLALIAFRSISSVVLHGSTTGMFGYGLASGRPGRYYMIAVAMHAGFNALASLDVIVQALGFGSGLVDAAATIELAAVIVVAFVAIEHVRRVIAASGALGSTQVDARYRPKVRPKTPPPVVQR